MDIAVDIKARAMQLQDLFANLDTANEEGKSAGQLRQKEKTKNQEESNENALARLINNPDLTSAVFPVYGATKAGKSTFMATLLGEKLLPEQAAAMTSIPIRIKHVVVGVSGPGKKLTIPQIDMWRQAIADFRRLLLAHELPGECLPPRDDVGGVEDKDNEDEDEGQERALARETNSILYSLQEDIRHDRVTLSDGVTDNASIRRELDTLSHFVRLLWINGIDFEKDYAISMEVDGYPFIEMEMAAFVAGGSGGDGSQRQFSFLDTPGPNEARALAALRNISPKIMRSSSGCIFCVPHDQVEHDGQLPLFDLINTTMVGKKVVVIVTKMDSFMDNSSTARPNMIRKIKKYFNKGMLPNVTFHMTSGHKVFFLDRFRRLLSQFNGTSSPQEIHAAVEASDLREDMTKYIPENFTRDKSLFTHEKMTQFVEDGLKAMKSEEVLNSFRSLYDEAELIALSGHMATIQTGHSRWLAEFKKLQDFALAQDDKKREIQDEIEKNTSKYEDVLGKLNKVPKRINNEMSEYIDRKAMETIIASAERMNSWRVVYELSDGTIKESDVIDFSGGLGSVKMWFRDTALPKFLPFVTGPARECLTDLKTELYRHVVEPLWTECKGYANDMIQHGAEDLDDLQVFFEQPPTIQIDVENSVNKLAKFDVDKVRRHELRDMVQIVNSEFKVDVKDQFDVSLQNMAAAVKEKLLADLTVVFDGFQQLVKREIADAKKRYERNEAYLQSQVAQQQFLDSVVAVDEANKIFQQDFAKLSEAINEKYIAAGMGEFKTTGKRSGAGANIPPPPP